MTPPTDLKSQILRKAEKWKRIPDHPDYQASSLGRIRGPKGLRQLYKNNKGYLRITLNGKTYGVHRLVLMAFRGKSDMHANHKNGIKYDNRLENLEFVTQDENNRHSWATGLNKPIRAERHGRAKLNWKKIDEIRESKLSQSALSRKYKVSRINIRHIQRNRLWKEEFRPTKLQAYLGKIEETK